MGTLGLIIALMLFICGGFVTFSNITGISWFGKILARLFGVAALVLSTLYIIKYVGWI